MNAMDVMEAVRARHSVRGCTERPIVGETLETLASEKRTSAVAHLYGVSLAATVIAQKRGLDAELLSMAAMLHDLYAYQSGAYDDHAHKGAELAREVLGKLPALTTPEETELICSAIYHHDDKPTADSPTDEALKDADVIHHA